MVLALSCAVCSGRFRAPREGRHQTHMVVRARPTMDAMLPRHARRAQKLKPGQASGAFSAAMDSASSRRPLQGKVALVTGSSRSIGASIARRLAADGADVIVNYHSVAVEAERTAYSINSRDGGRAYIVRADVSTIDGGRLLLQECVRLIGPPDILVLNAGVMGHKPLAETDEREFDAHMNTNIKGPLFMVQAAAKIIKPGACFSTLTRLYLCVQNKCIKKTKVLTPRSPMPQEVASCSCRPRSRGRRASSQ